MLRATVFDLVYGTISISFLPDKNIIKIIRSMFRFNGGYRYCQRSMGKRFCESISRRYVLINEVHHKNGDDHGECDYDT